MTSTSYLPRKKLTYHLHHQNLVQSMHALKAEVPSTAKDIRKDFLVYLFQQCKINIADKGISVMLNDVCISSQQMSLFTHWLLVLTINAAERQKAAPLALLAAQSSYSASRNCRSASAIAKIRGSCKSKGVPDIVHPPLQVTINKHERVHKEREENKVQIWYIRKICMFRSAGMLDN